MEAKNEKKRIVCILCLHSTIIDIPKDDTKESSLITVWSCDRCANASDNLSTDSY